MATDSRTVLAKAMTEDELLTAITEAATFLGWRWHHVRRSDKAVQMGHSGFPDLVLGKEGRVLFFELKSENGHLAPDQAEWVNALNVYGHGQAVAFVVRPSDLDFALALLR